MTGQAQDRPDDLNNMDAPVLHYDPTSGAAPEWLDHVTLGLSRDGLVYQAEPRDNRLQVLFRQGEYIKTFSSRRRHCNEARPAASPSLAIPSSALSSCRLSRTTPSGS